MKHILWLFLFVLPFRLLFAQRPMSGGTIDSTPRLANTLMGLRSSRPSQENKLFFMPDPGRQGSFIADPEDHVTPEDSTMTLVTSNGLRDKRVVKQNILNVKWFGAIGNGSADDWYAIQKGINYILNNDHACRTLYFPPG